MKNLFIYFFSFFLIFSCTHDDSIAIENLSDTELIVLIKNYDDKLEVSSGEMPLAAENYMIDNFINSTPQNRYLAQNLGYQVKMRRNGRSLNSFLSSMYVYFNLEGDILLNDYYDQDNDGDYDYDEDWEEELCFDIVFPIEFTMPDDSVYVAYNEDDFYDIIDSWYEEHPDVAEEPVIHFPIEIIWYSESENSNVVEEEVIQVNSMDELEEYYEMCEEDYYWLEIDCFDLVYPLTIVNPEGEVLTVDSENNLHEYIDQYYENCNSNDCGDFNLYYPLTVEYYSETNDQIQTLTINSEEELEEYLEEYCFDSDDYSDDQDWEDWEEELCFDIVFPIEFTMPDDSVYVAYNEDDFYDIIDSWYEEHPDVAEEPVIHFPIEIIWYSESENSNVVEEEVIQVNSMDELEEFIEMCEDSYDNDECDIYDLEVSVGECNEDGTYSITINFSYENPGNDYFEVYVRDDVLVDYFELSELPLTIENFEMSGYENDYIEVCINDMVDCCQEIEWAPPQCD